jgi:hypothetical protein
MMNHLSKLQPFIYFMFDLITLTSWSKGEKVGLVFSFSILFLRKKKFKIFFPKYFEFFSINRNFWGKFFDNGFVIKY